MVAGKQKPRLKFTEYQIMELLWLADKPLSIDRIVEAVGVGWTKLRKQQNVKACLNKLQKLGMVEMKEPSIYYAIYKKKELNEILAEERDYKYRKGSIILRLKSFLKADELSEKEVEELRKVLYEEVGREE
mgnify:FL=1